MALDIKTIISYEDHFIMMLWEQHLLEQLRKPDEIIRELEDLAIALDSLRCKSETLPISFPEFFLLRNVEEMLKGKNHNRQIDMLAKIKLLLDTKSNQLN